MSLMDALNDIKNEVINGNTVDMVLNDISEEYGLNPNLVRRKFFELHSTEDAVRNNTKTEESKADSQKIERMIKKACDFYHVSIDGCQVGIYKGVKYTIIGKRNSKIVMVSHKDGDVWHMREWAFQNVKIEN